MELSKEKLMKKGWSAKEISKTLEIIERAKKSKHPAMQLLDEYIYWIALFLAIGVNLLIAFTSLPFLVTLTPWVLYLILVVIAFSFGLFFAILINDIENLEKGYHLIIGLIVPIYSIVFFFVITTISNNIIEKINILRTPTHNPWLIALVYSIVFISPYIYYQFVKK